MIKKNKNVLKHSSIDLSFPEISPAKNFIPDWYKNAPPFKDGQKTPKRLPFPLTFKKCIVFLDSFTTGYMIPLSVDICVEKTDMGQLISWNDESNSFVELRDSKINELIPTPVGYSEQHYVWKTKNMFKIPKGYSAFLGHPLNRFDLPFLTLSGIIDGEMCVYDGNVPVFFKKDFEGLIPAGTPIAQLFLFKTENWTSKVDKTIIEEGKNNLKKSLNLGFGWYKKNIWKKKTYE
jgi:hypothetical protein